LPKAGRPVDLVVSEQAAELVGERLAAAARGGGHVVLTGGASVGPAYEAAARLQDDWTAVELWWGDERCVPPDDERSNYGLAKATLLDRVRLGPVHRMQGELGRDEGARRYEEELDGVDVFDLVLLGLGPDGHVASLFPGRPTLDETERRVVGAEAGLEPFVDRITLTVPALCAAREVLFFVTGESKTDAVAAVFAGDPSRQAPGSLVRAAHGETTAVLDPAAAAKL
jgi:6-phosphogluconolactonase